MTMWKVGAIGIAILFYYIGEHEYRGKGFLFALISVMLSVAIAFLTPFEFYGTIGVNLLFFIALWIWNIFTDPAESSARNKK